MTEEEEHNNIDHNNDTIITKHWKENVYFLKQNINTLNDQTIEIIEKHIMECQIILNKNNKEQQGQQGQAQKKVSPSRHSLRNDTTTTTTTPYYDNISYRKEEERIHSKIITTAATTTTSAGDEEDLVEDIGHDVHRRPLLMTPIPLQPPLPIPIPIEVLRQITSVSSTFLTTNELGKFLLLTCQSFHQLLGQEYIWKQICLMKFSINGTTIRRHFPTSTNIPIMTTSRTTPSRSIPSYEWLFRQLDGSDVRLQQQQLPPLRLAPTILPHQISFLITVWNDQGKIVVAETIHSLDMISTLLTQATVTLDLDEINPIPVGNLPRNRCHCWNLPRGDAYTNWRAKVHVIISCCNQNGQQQQQHGNSSSTTTTTNNNNNSHTNCIHCKCHCVLDTNFTWWRGWSKVGELTFLQKDQRHGLEVTEYGKYLEHRIIRSSSCAGDGNHQRQQHHQQQSSWESGYLGLQFKLVLLCHPKKKEQHCTDPNDVVHFEFQEVKLEAIRIHEKKDIVVVGTENNGRNTTPTTTVQHYLFRNDTQHQHHHGVELLHLLGELY